MTLEHVRGGLVQTVVGMSRKREMVRLESWEKLYCPNCKRWFEQHEDFVCTHCHQKAEVSVHWLRCNACGNDRVLSLRSGLLIDVGVCPCQLTPEQRKRKAELDAEQRRRDEQEAKEESRVRLLRVDRRNAEDCWESKARACDVIEEDPRWPFCIRCPKWEQRDERPRRRKRKEGT